MRRADEYHLTVAVSDYLRLAAPDLIWFHCPNGEVRDPRTAAKLKRMGVLPGVPDFCLILPGGRFCGIELKTDKGKLSPAQEAFQTACDEAGGLYIVCRSVEQVDFALRAHGVPLRARAA